ncbi:MAG: GntR family transcriptional regulator [Bacillota bacterium]|nr:GntR family transcriptional regulator [Bacillota bacterium]
MGRENAYNNNEIFAGFAEYAAQNEFVPMRELIYQYLRDTIIDFRIPAGAHLVEDELAENLNASRTPVREALRKLESEGLVKHHRRRGVEVRQLSLDDVTDIYEVAMVLEAYAARLVAESGSADALDKLQTLLRKMKSAIDEGNSEQEQELHKRFHLTIYESCRNRRIEEILKTYSSYILLFRAYTMQEPGRMLKSWEEHDAMVRAIEMRDGKLAERRTFEHMNDSKEVFLKQWRQMLGE